MLIKGETDHYDMIKDAVSSAIMQVRGRKAGEGGGVSHWTLSL